MQKHPPGGFLEKSFSKIVQNVTGNHICRSLFFNKGAEWSLATALKNTTARAFR